MKDLGLDTYAHLDSPLHRWDGRYKLIALLALILAFSAVQTLWLVPVMGAVTAGLYRLSRLPWHFWCDRLRLPGYFLLGLVIALPFFTGQTVWWQWGQLRLTQEGTLAALLISGRFLCILTVGMVLFGTAPFLQSLQALRSLGLPPLLSDMTLLAYRYLYEIGDRLTTMQRAMRLRGFQAHRLNRRHLPHVAALTGSLLIRSYEQSERVYHAMRLRGYGQSPGPVSAPPASVNALRSPDALGLYAVLAIALVLLLADGVLGRGL